MRARLPFLTFAALLPTLALAQAPQRPGGLGEEPRTYACALEKQESEIRQARDRLASSQKTDSERSQAISPDLIRLHEAVGHAVNYVEQKTPQEVSRQEAYTRLSRQAREASVPLQQGGRIPLDRALASADGVLRALDELRRTATGGAAPAPC